MTMLRRKVVEEKSSAADKPQKSEEDMNLEVKLVSDREKCQQSLQHLSWYHGTLNRNLAEIKLGRNNAIVGCFLVRKSMVCQGDYVLSFVTDNGFDHFMIQQRKQLCYSLDKIHLFKGLDLLIAHYCQEKGCLPTMLTSPCLGGTPPPHVTLRQGPSTILHQAIAKGDTVLALQIISNRLCPVVNSKDENGRTCLHLTCMKNMEEVTKCLVKKGAVANIRDKNDHTALQYACMHNQPGVIPILLTDGKADAQDRHPETGNVALHEAAERGHIKCVQALLSRNVPVWPRNERGMTPNELAVRVGHNQCAKLMDDYVVPPAETDRMSYFHSDLNQNAAVNLMTKHGLLDGLFLIRRSSKRPENFILNVCHNVRVFSYEIQLFDGKVFSIAKGPLYSTLEHLVEHYAVYIDGLATTLIYTLSENGDIQQIGSFESVQDGLAISDASKSARSGSDDYIVPEELKKQLADNAGKIPCLPKECSSTPAGEKIQYQLSKGYELGQGEYGSVFRGSWMKTDGTEAPVAVKTLNASHMADRDQFLNEAKIMLQLNQPYIVKLIGVCEGPPLMLVQELVSLGSMLDFLLDYPEKIQMRRDLYLWAAQVACGMSFLEKSGYVHRDLAARNLLLQSMDHVKVGDFGLSRAFSGESNYYKATKGGRWPVKWYAPESINYGKFSAASDVWSYGVTLWEMFTFGDQPYSDMKGAEVLQFIEQNRRLEQPDKCPDKVFQIMRQCWSYKASDRPTFSGLYSLFRRDPEYVGKPFFLKKIDNKFSEA